MFMIYIVIISIDLSHIDSSILLNMNSFCDSCNSLKSIDLSNLNASLLEDMESMLSNCASLIYVNFTKFKTKSLIKIGRLFSGCYSLKSIDLSGFNTSNVISMESMFYGCDELEYLLLSNFDTTSVTSMNYMFNGCSHLKFLDISNFNMKNVKETEYMFEDVNKQKYINLYNVKNSYQNITKSYLSKIKELTVCQRPTEKIITNDNAINKCCYFNNSNICENNNYILIKFGKEAEYNYGFISDTYNGYQFRKGIEFIIMGLHQRKINGTDKLYIPKGAILEIYFSSNIKSLQNFFSANYDYNMENIISIDFTHFDSSSVTDMSSTFFGCRSLRSIDLSNFKSNSINNMKFMFFGCSSLESIDLSNFETSLEINMNFMFGECSSLKSINLSNFDIGDLTHIGKIFYNIKTLISIYLTNNNSLTILNMSEINENITRNEISETIENTSDISLIGTLENISTIPNIETTYSTRVDEKNETTITITENYTEINGTHPIYIITEQIKVSSLNEGIDSNNNIPSSTDNNEFSSKIQNINISQIHNNTENITKRENDSIPSNICKIEHDFIFSKINLPTTPFKENKEQINISLSSESEIITSSQIKNNISYRQKNIKTTITNIINKEKIISSNKSSIKITSIETLVDKYFFPEINIELNKTIPILLKAARKNINLAHETLILLFGFSQISRYSSYFYIYSYSLKNIIFYVIRFPLSLIYYITIRISKINQEFTWL